MANRNTNENIKNILYIILKKCNICIINYTNANNILNYHCIENVTSFTYLQIARIQHFLLNMYIILFG